MVAWAAIEALQRGVAHEADGQEVRARWPLGKLAQGVGDIATKKNLDKGALRRALRRSASRKGVAA